MGTFLWSLYTMETPKCGCGPYCAKPTNPRDLSRTTALVFVVYAVMFMIGMFVIEFGKHGGTK